MRRRLERRRVILLLERERVSSSNTCIESLLRWSAVRLRFRRVELVLLLLHLMKLLLMIVHRLPVLLVGSATIIHRRTLLLLMMMMRIVVRWVPKLVVCVSIVAHGCFCFSNALRSDLTFSNGATVKVT